MKSILIVLLLMSSFVYGENGFPDEPVIEEYTEDQPQQNGATSSAQNDDVLMKNSSMAISVVGQGVAPAFATSPAQAYALAKRAATADAYRLIAEKVKGVRVQGKDTIKNMMVKNSTVNTRVAAMVKNASVVETKFENGLCEVEMEIILDYKNF